MDKRTITLIVTLFGLIVLGMFVFAYLKKTEVSAPAVPEVNPPEQPMAYPNITRITAKHFYSNNKHTFAGELELPTPCDLLDVQSTVRESFPEQVTLDFMVINNAESCMQVITNQRFLVEAQASEEATITATFMGRPVELNLIPAAPGETPDDFEIFIKG